MAKDTETVFELLAKLNADKSTILTLWQEIAEFSYPGQRDFYRYFSGSAQGNKRRRPIFDSTGEMSLDIFASSMVGLLANPATKWVAFQTDDVELLNNREVQLFLDEAQTKVLSVFNNPRTKFYDNLFTLLKFVGAFGAGALLIDDDPDTVNKFRAESPRNFDYTEDFSGNVDEVFLEREFTVGALMTKAESDDWEIPQDIQNRPHTDKVNIVRHIYPNPDYNPEGLGEKFARFHSKYYLKETKTLVKTGFFSMSPAAIARWDKLDSEKWPDSPGRVALSNVKLAQAANKALIVAMEKELQPTLFLSSEAKFGKLDTSAGAVNVGRGNPSDNVRELRTNGSGLLAAIPWIESIRQQIRTAYYVDVFQTAVDINMTATEAQIRNQERLRGIAPKATKIQSDVLGPAAEKVLQTLIKSGKLKVPDVLARAGGEIKVVYLSPLAQAQRLNDARNVLTFLQDIATVAQAYPEVLDSIDPDAVIEEMADIRGVPEKILRASDAVEQIRQQRQQQQQAQQQLQMIQQTTEVAKGAQEAQL